MIKESDSVCELVSDDNFVITDKNSLNRPDPVRQICDIPVKIADLGNACWTVSGRERERERLHWWKRKEEGICNGILWFHQSSLKSIPIFVNFGELIHEIDVQFLIAYCIVRIIAQKFTYSRNWFLLNPWKLMKVQYLPYLFTIWLKNHLGKHKLKLGMTVGFNVVLFGCSSYISQTTSRRDSTEPWRCWLEQGMVLQPISGALLVW